MPVSCVPGVAVSLNVLLQMLTPLIVVPGRARTVRPTWLSVALLPLSANVELVTLKPLITLPAPPVFNQMPPPKLLALALSLLKNWLVSIVQLVIWPLPLPDAPNKMMPAALLLNVDPVMLTLLTCAVVEGGMPELALPSNRLLLMTTSSDTPFKFRPLLLLPAKAT